MECMHLAKGLNITTFLIGHVTKSGDIAGPRVLEHIVDAVFEFEGDKQHGYRLLRYILRAFSLRKILATTCVTGIILRGLYRSAMETIL